MRGYKEFLIAPQTEGLDKSLAPWLTPDKAFTELTNVYIEKGVIKERRGVTKYGQLGTFVDDETYATPDDGKVYGKTLDHPTPILGSLSITSSSPAQTVYIDNVGDSSGDGTATLTSAGVSTVTFTANVATGETITCDYHYSDTGTDRVVRGVHYFNRDLTTYDLIALDNRRLSQWETTYGYFKNIPSGTTVTSEAWDAGDDGTSYSKSGAATTNISLVPFTVKITGGTQILYDNGLGGFMGDKGGGTNSIVYSTGKISVDFKSAVASGTDITIDYLHTATPVYDTFDNPALTWGLAWQNVYWLIDNSSNIHIFKHDNYGTNVIDITPRLKLGASGELLTTARCMIVFKERLIFFNTYENNERFSQRARWSAQGNCFTLDAWRDDISGQGDFNDAPTDDEIITIIPLKDRIVVFFEHTIGFLLYTGNPDLPFSWQMLSSTMETDSTFGFWQLEQYVISLGKFNLTACDGVNAQRADAKIPDFTLDIDYEYIDQCYGHIIPEKRQAWMAYPSRSGNNYPDKVLVYNFDEDLVSIYSFLDGDTAGTPLATRCFANYFYILDCSYTYLSNAKYWPEIKTKIDAAGRNAYYDDYQGYTYAELGHQAKDPIVLAGSNDGYIYNVDDNHANNDNGEDYNFSIVTKRFNPYQELGVGVSLGYVDFLVSAMANCEAEVTFFLGFSGTPAIKKKFNCEGTGNKLWKRVYCNATSDVIGYKVSHPVDSEFNNYSFELHAHKPAFKTGGNVIR